MADGIVRGAKQVRDKVVGIQNKLSGLEDKYYKKTDAILNDITTRVKSVLPDDWYASDQRKEAEKKYGSDTLKKHEGSTNVKSLLSDVMSRAKEKKDIIKKVVTAGVGG